MDLRLTSSGPSDTQHLDHSLSLPYGINQTAMLAGMQENGLQERMNYSHGIHISAKYPLTRWVGDPGPWHPRGLTSNTEDISGQSMLSAIRDGQYIPTLQSNAVPSEIMPQSDSGYGSYNNRRSIADGSVCDDAFDTNIDTQSIIGGPMDVASKNAMVLGGAWANQMNHIRLETMKCEECGKLVKTKSELKFVSPISGFCGHPGLIRLTLGNTISATGSRSSAMSRIAPAESRASVRPTILIDIKGACIPKARPRVIVTSARLALVKIRTRSGLGRTISRLISNAFIIQPT